MGFIYRKCVLILLNIIFTCYVSTTNHSYKSNVILVSSANFKEDFCETRSMAYKGHHSIHQTPCKPRETMIKIMSQNSSMIVTPRQVWLKRCEERGCFESYSCVPTKIEKVSVRIYQRDFLTGSFTCGQLMMEQHSSCACSCDLQRFHSCPENQQFMADTCKCACADKEQERQCKHQSNEKKIWDSFTCSCRCKEKSRSCTTGSVWDPKICKCVIEPENSQLLYDDYFN